MKALVRLIQHMVRNGETANEIRKKRSCLLVFFTNKRTHDKPGKLAQ